MNFLFIVCSLGYIPLSAAVSREEKHRAKIRFKQVIGKDQPFLTQRKFCDLLGNRT